MMREYLNEYYQWDDDLGVALHLAALLAKAKGIRVEDAQVRFGLYMLAEGAPAGGCDDTDGEHADDGGPRWGDQ
jgi:hypothetical protein